jgi:uncharacterized protein (TIGR03083 family)
MDSDPRKWIATLRGSHERLSGLVAQLTPEQLRAQSYDTEWTNAQVLSHIGSGAEIAMIMMPTALGETGDLDTGAFQAVWDRWNAKSPDEQAADVLPADEQYVRALEQLSDEQLAGIAFPFLGMQLDAVGLIRLRLSEHAMHTWDIAVFLDPAAAVAAEAVELLVDNVPQFLAPRLGKPQDPAVRARITTTRPERDYLLTAGPDEVAMSDWAGAGPAEAAGAGEVAMPAEALLRLSYGRLDPGHTPESVTGNAELLGRLRAVFPGF